MSNVLDALLVIGQLYVRRHYAHLNKHTNTMKKHIIKTIGCIAAAFAFAGCAHTPNTTTQKDRQQQVAISIAHDGTLSVAGEHCRQSELTARLRELVAKQQTAAAVVVRADADAPYKQVVAVMDACKTAGVQQVILATTK